MYAISIVEVVCNSMFKKTELWVQNAHSTVILSRLSNIAVTLCMLYGFVCFSWSYLYLCSNMMSYLFQLKKVLYLYKDSSVEIKMEGQRRMWISSTFISKKTVPLPSKLTERWEWLDWMLDDESFSTFSIQHFSFLFNWILYYTHKLNYYTFWRNWTILHLFILYCFILLL